MSKRSPFWLGLLLGGLASFGARRLWLPSRSGPLDPLLDLVSDAVVLCDASGAITDMNTAARALLGLDGAGLSRLRYPSGQPVPPGQLLVNRVLRTGKDAEGVCYLYLSAEGKAHTLDIRATRLPDRRVVMTACDRTEIGEGRAREAKAQGREDVLRALSRRLSAAPGAEELAQALVESALALAASLPDVRVRLYSYDSGAKRLTRLASAPDDRPKRPRSHRQAQRPTFPFDAASPLLWSLYVARQPVVGADVGDDAAGPAYALPLLVGGVALGHLSITCPDVDGLAASDLRETLGLLASLTALALAGPCQEAQAVHLAAQMEALRVVLQAVGEPREQGALADLVSREVRGVLRAEVCTLTLRDEGGLRLIGTAYRDALLFPERRAPDDAALVGDTAREAMRKGKAIQRTGLANPPFEAGIWHAFAGQSGRHSVVSVSLAAGQGALTAYAAGDAPFPDAQVKFLETLAALLSATLPEASQPAERTDS
jgi:hypothetical protein